MENNESPNAEVEVLPPETTLVDALKEAPIDVAGLEALEQISLIVSQSVRKPLWKMRLSGGMKTSRKAPKVNRFWYNGNLITKEEHDKLSVEEIYASNNKV
jgi:hypothetical protein